MKKEIRLKCLGYELKADLYESDSDVILLCLSGRTSSRKKFGYMVEAIVNKTGFGAYQFDYSGHGDSEFDWQEISAAEQFVEVNKAFDWLKQNYPDKKIYVFGTSFGGYLAAQLTKYRQFARLILAAPAIYPPESFYDPAKATHASGSIKDNPDHYRNKYDEIMQHPLLKSGSGRFNNPVLVVVHGDDENIPPPTTDAYIQSFKADKVLIEDIPHSTEHEQVTTEQLEQYQNAISDWLVK